VRERAAIAVMTARDNDTPPMAADDPRRDESPPF
jgi:hypothetical protein